MSGYARSVMYFTPLFVSDYCPGSPTQRYLTDGGGSSTFPPLVSDAVVASSQSTYPRYELFDFSYPFDLFCWCSGTIQLPQNVTVHFTEPLVIHGILLGGYGSGSSRSYVTAFSLEYSETENSDLIVDHLPKVCHSY